MYQGSYNFGSMLGGLDFGKLILEVPIKAVRYRGPKHPNKGYGGFLN